MLKSHLDIIMPTIQKRNDIEVLISDDCSTQDIESLLKIYSCENLHYKRTPSNLVHDLNILYAIENAQSKYVMILRTRDNLYVENLDSIIDSIFQNPDVGYYLFSAKDDKGNLRLNLEDRIYPIEISCQAHFKLIVHPSGNIYNREYLEVKKYRDYIIKHFDTIYGFEVHELIRCDLSTQYEFLTSSIVGWVYADTLSATDVAVNSSKSGKNIYAPEFCYPRYRCYLDFTTHEVPNNARIMYVCDAINRYYYYAIARAKTLSNDKRYNAHYNSSPSKIKRKDVARKMDSISYDYLQGFTKNEMNHYKRQIEKSKMRCLLLYSIREFGRNMLIDTSFYSKYRRYMEKKTAN